MSNGIGSWGDPAATNTTGQWTVIALLKALLGAAGGGGVGTVRYAAFGASSSGNNTLVAAVSGKKIRVLAMFVLAAGAVNLYFTSGVGGTIIFGDNSGKINLAANGGFVLPYSPVGWFENNNTNQALVVNLSGAVAISGGLVYVEV